MRYLSHRLRVTQPQALPRVNWGNPLARGMTSFVIPVGVRLALFDVVRNCFLYNTDQPAYHTLTSHNGGIVAATNGYSDTNGGSGWLSQYPHTGRTVLTALVVAAPALSSYGSRGSAMCAEQSYMGFSGSPPVPTGTVAASGYLYGTGFPTVQGQFRTMAMRHLYFDYAFAVDGAIASTYQGNYYSYFADTDNPMRICGMIPGMNHEPVHTAVAVTWGRHLSNSELCEVTRRPWELVT